MHPRTVLAALLLTACTEPTWYPGLPPDVPAGDSGGGGDDSGAGGLDLPCSTDGPSAATLTIDLQSGADLTLFWRDHACAEIDYGPVVAGTLRPQATYLGHAWVLRSASGVYRGHIVVDEVDERWEVAP